MKRGGWVALFAAGVLVAVGLGCLLAAYDLWGGVPRSLWPVARWSVVVALLCLAGGAIGYVTSWPPGQRLRAALLGGLALAGLAAVTGVALWFHYSARLRTSHLACAPALVAPTRAAREQALRDGLGPLFPVIDPSWSCIQLLREKNELERTGRCPMFVMEDAPCTCGRQSWTGGPHTPGRCADGPTACQYRNTAMSLGCAEHGSAHILREAREAPFSGAAK